MIVMRNMQYFRIFNGTAYLMICYVTLIDKRMNNL